MSEPGTYTVAITTTAPVVTANVAIATTAPVEAAAITLIPEGPPGPAGPVASQTRRHAYAAPYSYCGRAAAGSAEAAGVWDITRIAVANDGSATTATATAVAWTDYLTATYA